MSPTFSEGEEKGCYANMHALHTHRWKCHCGGRIRINSFDNKPGLNGKVGQDYEYH